MIENLFTKDLFLFIVKLNLVDQVVDPFVTLAHIDSEKLDYIFNLLHSQTNHMPSKSRVKFTKVIEILFEGKAWVSWVLVNLKQISKEKLSTLVQILL